MNKISVFVERLPTVQFVGGSIVLIGGAGLGGVALEGIAAVISAVVGLVALVAWAWAVVHRRRVRHLPLLLGLRGTCDVIDGCDTYAFRAMLGRGRVMHPREVDVRFLPEEGQEVRLSMWNAADGWVVGPWTIAVRDPSGRCRSPGRFAVTVRVVSGQKEWCAQRQFQRAALENGRFSAPVIWNKGKLVTNLSRWDQVESQITSA